mgnify:CR=1 FL=1
MNEMKSAVMQREHGAQREVAEDVERPDVLRQELGQPQAASVRPFAAGRTAQRRDDALHAHEARALDEDRRPGRRVAARCAASAATDAKCCAPAPNAAALSAASAPDGQQSLDAGMRARSRRLRDGKRGPFAPTSPMSPRTSQRGARRRREHVDCGEHRIRVRVVGIVDHGRAGRRLRSAPGARQPDETPRARARSRASGTPIASAAAAAASAFAALCRPGAASRTDASPSGVAKSRSASLPAPTRRRRRTAAAASSAKSTHAHALALTRRGAPDVGMGIVGVQHDRCRPGGSARTIAACSSRHVGDAAHEFLMLALGVVDRRRWSVARWRRARPSRRDGSCRSRSRPPRAPRADASNVSGRPIALLRLPSVASTLRAAEVSAQHRRQHFLHRRLAVAADDDDDRQRKPGAPVRRQDAEARRAGPARR